MAIQSLDLMFFLKNNLNGNKTVLIIRSKKIPFNGRLGSHHNLTNFSNCKPAIKGRLLKL